MKMVSYNVNGLRQRISQFGSLRNLLNSFDADILCFQETKLRRQELTADLIMADGYESFFSCTRTSQKGRTGYSGVITFCRVKSAFSSNEVALPLAAEEGFTGLLENSQTSKDELPFMTDDLKEFSKDELISLDSEGRCIITDHTHFGADFENNEFRKWFKSMLIENGGQFCDAFRAKHPDRREAYTCWSQSTGAEVFNFGSRIDHILFSGSCLHESDDLQWHSFVRCHVKECDILTQYKRCKPESTPSAHRWKEGRSIKLEGSDHAPVFVSLHEISEVSLHSTPSLSARYVPMVHGIQQTLGTKHRFFFGLDSLYTQFFVSEPFLAVSVLMKRKVSEQIKSCKMAHEDIAIHSTYEGEEPVNRAASSATSPNECRILPRQVYKGSILKPNEVSGGSSQEAVSKSVNESEKSIMHKCKKPNKKARNSQSSQLSLRSFFQRSTNLDNDINGSSYTDCSTSQDEPSQPNPQLHETPTVSDHSISPKQCSLDTDARDQDLAGPKDSSIKEEKSNLASLEWQRIQQLMQNSIPICKGHKEPCIARVVKKQGPNFGRRFYVCARAEGPASNPEANCGYFGWASSKSRNK